MAFEVALVSGDDDVRHVLVRAFDRAPRSWVLTLRRDPPDRADVVVCGPDVDIEGAVRFDPADPARVLDDVAARVRKRARVIGVTSASGGTGVTTVALHVAAGFASRGFETGFVDLDRQWGVGGRIGLDPDETRPGSETRVVPVAGGFRLYVPAANVGSASAVAGAADRFDMVVVDSPGIALDDGAAESWSCALLLVAPSPEGARRARSIIDAHPDVRWLAVVNRVGPGGETTAHAIARELGSSNIIELPCCPRLRDAEDDARLLRTRTSRWSRRIARLAAHVAP